MKLADHRFEDIQIGMEQTFERQITPEMVSSFTEMSGDINPLHLDDEFAFGRGFKGRVVYGLLTASFFSTLVGVCIPGRNALLHGINVSFVKPVYIGEMLSVKGEVVHKSAAYQVIEIRGSIRNISGELVSRATIRCGIFSE